MSTFDFESYGVSVRISGDADLVEEAAKVARRSLLGNVRSTRKKTFAHHFELTRSSPRVMRLDRNGEYLSSGRSRLKFFKFLDALIRVSVGEASRKFLFVHAGVVGWRGKAIVMPANSFQGKSTLVAELVRRGATYYSDDFGLIDPNGIVHPFARPISMRSDAFGTFVPYEIPLDELGQSDAPEPIPIGLFLLTQYRAGSRWSPAFLSRGEGNLAIMPFALSISRSPAFVMDVLHKATSAAPVVRTARAEAGRFAKKLIDFFDKIIS